MNSSRRNMLKLIPALALLPFYRAFAEGEEPTLLRINIPGPRSLPFLPIELIPILGIDRGMNAQLIIRYFPSGIRALEDMIAGNAQFSAQGFTVLEAFYRKGMHVQALAPLSGQVPPYGLVVRNDLRNKIIKLADLKGRSIGVSVGSITSKTYLQQVMEVFLSSHGVGAHEVRWVPTAQNWDGQFGALSSKSVDAVFCEEPFLTGLQRKKAGFVISDLNDPRVREKIPGTGHLRATITTTADNLSKAPQQAETMVRMLNQSLGWLAKAKPNEIVARLDIQDKDERIELIEVLARRRGMYAKDARFSQRQIEATTQFMRAAGILADASFDPNTLIASQFAGVKP